MLDRLGDVIRAWAYQPVPVLSIALGRTLLALSGLGTLIFTDLSDLIRPAAGHVGPFCDGVAGVSLWCVTGSDEHWVAESIAIAVLIASAAGFFSRYFSILMWWVLFSNQVSFTTIDGGDQIAAVLALLLIPISITDGRVNHWMRGESRPDENGLSPLVIRWSLLLVQIQVCYVYLNACLTKLSSPEWVDGTALYYWFRHPMFGPPESVAQWIDWFTLEPIPLAALGWGTLVLEFLLGISLLLPAKARIPLLASGLLLHLGIAVFMGLWSFAFVMWAGLILAFRPERVLKAIGRTLRSRPLRTSYGASASRIETSGQTEPQTRAAPSA